MDWPAAGEEVEDEKPFDILQVPGVALEPRSVLPYSLFVSEKSNINFWKVLLFVQNLNLRAPGQITAAQLTHVIYIFRYLRRFKYVRQILNIGKLLFMLNWCLPT